MKIAIVYNHIERASSSIGLPKDWADRLNNFIDSYKRSSDINTADLFICSSGGSPHKRYEEKLKDIKYKLIVYYGTGWDIGAYQFAAYKILEYDFAIFVNANVSFVNNNWLVYFKNAFKKYGYGVYGASSSFEISPHIRTSCIASPPSLLISYPITARSRYDGCVFEHSPKNFSLWCMSKKINCFVVTSKNVTALLDSRRIINQFRSGDQSLCLISDRHIEIYNRADKREKITLSKLADGKIKSNFIENSKIKNYLSICRNKFYTCKNMLLEIIEK